LADQVCDFIGDNPGFTGSGTGQNQTGPGNEFDSMLLAGV